MTHRPHILLVDDDQRLRDLLKRYLSQNGFSVTLAEDGKGAMHILQNMDFDLMVLDEMMPNLSGFEVMRQLREGNKSIPSVLLTARDAANDRIQGLELGADDYVTKPFEPRELVLRIHAILRRSQPQSVALPSKPLRIGFAGFDYDLANGVLMRKGEMVSLTTAESALLTALSENAPLPCSREDLVKMCFIEGGERAIDVQVMRLRRKIEQDPANPRYIQTVRGKGYVIKPESISLPEAE